MPHLDRDGFVALLNRLGDADDATVLAAARAIDARMREAGLGWSDLLVPPPGTGVDEEMPAVETAEAPPEGAGEPGPEECAHDLALIEAMLARSSLSAETRSELEEMRDQIADGAHSRMDSRYLRGLHARLAGPEG